MTYLSFSTRLRPLLTALVPLFVLAPSACESNVKEKIALAQLAQDCLVNSDCSAPLVCAFEACHAECVSSRDCDEGARCVAAARPYKVCQLETERKCERTADCVEGLICGVDGECRDKCRADSECVEDQVCVSGTCADKDELDENGLLSPAKGMTRGAEGSPCVYVSDCSEALLCRSQACLPECKADKDCAVHQVCMDTRCVADGSQPASCDYNSDCDAKRGERCLRGSCLCQCVEDRDCPSGDVCNGCGCEADPKADPGCTYNSDCKNPGEICKDRACSCQCKADVDCGNGFRCDGCGCLDARNPLDGVVQGNVTIDSSLQLALYRGVTEIHGDLIISGISITDLGDTFDQLAVVDGTLQIWSATNLHALSLPQLTTITNISLSGDNNISSVSLPALKSANVNITQLLVLKSLSLPALESGALSLNTLPQLEQLSLNSLKTLSELHFNDIFAMKELSMPELVTVGAWFQISNSSPSALAKLSAPKLQTTGKGLGSSWLTIDNTQLTSLDGLGDPQNFVGHCTALQLSRNLLLSQCAVDAFATKCPDRTQTFIADAIACPSACEGAVCPG